MKYFTGYDIIIIATLDIRTNQAYNIYVRGGEWGAMKARDVLKILYADGWYELKGKGTSHIQLKHPVKNGKVTVSFHGSDDIGKGTFNSIMKQAGLKE